MANQKLSDALIFSEGNHITSIYDYISVPNKITLIIRIASYIVIPSGSKTYYSVD